MKIQNLIGSGADYFLNYAGSGQRYDKVWSDYSYAEELVTLIKSGKAGDPQDYKRFLVLGAATGKILKFFDRRLAAKSWGCEINDWAHRQIPLDFRRRIRRCDMREYVRDCGQRGRHFDLAFANSFIYLPKNEISPFLTELARVSRRIHFNSSFRGHACPDPYRQTLESFDWWNKKFARAGYSPVPVKGQRRSYLWELKDGH